MRGILAPVLFVGLGLFTPRDAAPQGAPLVLELHGGASVPVGVFHDGTGPGEGAGAGASFGVDVAMSRSDRRTLYLGFSQHRFGCRAAGCPAGASYIATGVDAGFRISLVTRGSVIPWVRLGALTTRVEARDLPAPNGGVTKLGVGGEAGFGVYIGTTSAVALMPGVRYSLVNTGLPGGSTLSMRYLVADLALALAF